MDQVTMNQLKSILSKHPLVIEVTDQSDNELGVWTTEDPHELNQASFGTMIQPLLGQLGLKIIRNDCPGYYNEYLIYSM